MEKAARLSELKIAMSLNSEDQPTWDDVGFLITCLNEAEFAARTLRQTCNKIRDSREVVIADLERKLVEALETIQELTELVAADVKLVGDD